MKKITPIILCGGSGNRLWPISSSTNPKQFLKIDDELTMLEKTLNRINHDIFQDPILISHKEYQYSISEILKQQNFSHVDVILEPMQKNTAAAIASCLAHGLEQDDLIYLIMPSDHIINNQNGFYDAIQKALKHIDDETIFTFGVLPTHADTAYGYIGAGDKIDRDVFKIDKFYEKPNKERAEHFIKKGHFFWNSGMFLCSKNALEQAFFEFAPVIYQLSKDALENAYIHHDKDIIYHYLEREIFAKIEAASFDIAIMEKCLFSKVVKVDMDWFDIGSWSSLYDTSTQKDKSQNVIKGVIETIDVTNSFIQNEMDTMLVSVAGVDDVVVACKDHCVLVLNKSKTHLMGDLITKMKQSVHSDLMEASHVKRPWGFFEMIEKKETYCIKKLCIEPEQSISLQYHHHRSEHWIILEGVAHITKGEEVHILTKNQSIFIAQEEIHCIENRGDERLYIIEVQSGSLLSEDDIVRLKDEYGRLKIT